MTGSMFKIFIAVFIVAMTAVSYAASVKQPKMHHKEGGVSCVDCHETDNPLKGAEETACLNCHGSREDITALTEKVDPNPHFGHEDGLTCDSCHREHEDSVLYCDDCHQWGLITP